ncbi:MAG: metallophosphoesterase [Candidatus Cloacimonetes bacterium]|nr:metallophosphoesterase [Candidatus Cloacimonadota bacterium]
MTVDNYQIFSDLHLEFHQDKGKQFLESIIVSAENVILAGDICAMSQMYKVYREFSNKYKKVFFVLGNHEFYGHTFEGVFLEASRIEKDFKNVHWLNRSIFKIGDHRILGSTLWFSDTIDNSKYQHRLSDFSRIRDFEKSVYEQNELDKSFLFNEVQEDDIVVTHHLPCRGSVLPKFADSDLTRFFYCDMSHVIENNKPSVWVHGHAHDVFDYIEKSTRIVCNPYGYHATLAETYDYDCLIESRSFVKTK